MSTMFRTQRDARCYINMHFTPELRKRHRVVPTRHWSMKEGRYIYGYIPQLVTSNKKDY